jgi:hypothetical protein
MVCHHVRPACVISRVHSGRYHTKNIFRKPRNQRHHRISCSSRFLLLIPIYINANATTGLLLCFLGFSAPPAAGFKATALALRRVIIVYRVGDDNFDKSNADANMIIDRASSPSSISPPSRHWNLQVEHITLHNHLLLPSHGHIR